MDSWRMYRPRPGFPPTFRASLDGRRQHPSAADLLQQSWLQALQGPSNRSGAGPLPQQDATYTPVPYLTCNEKSMAVAEVSASWLSQGTQTEEEQKQRAAARQARGDGSVQRAR
jgi:hypothetical protein